MKKIQYLCYFIVVLALISTSVGFFYSTGGESFTVENIYREAVTLYGDGIYKNDSFFKAGISKGTDFVMFFVAILFTIFTVKRKNSAAIRFLHAGLLVSLLYYSSCMVFGVTFNRLFLLYVLLFSASLFATIFLLRELILENNLSEEIKSNHLKGTAVFLIVSGSSVLVWLQFIIPAIITGQPLSIIETYTTEPTFVLDLGIILPTYLGCGIALLRKQEIGYKLTPILLTFITIIGIIVISQQLVQVSMGIYIPINELIGFVITFVVLGIIASILNIRFMKQIS